MTLEGNDKAKIEFLVALAEQVWPQSQEISTNLMLCAKRLKELTNESTTD